MNWDDADASRRVAESDYLNNETWRSNIRLLAELNLVFEFHVYPAQYSSVAQVVLANPDVQFVLDHIGCPARDTEEQFEHWRSSLDQFKGLPNLHCKVSGLVHPGYVSEWSPESLAKWIKHTVDVFGVNRCIYGSNFPVDRVNATYSAVLSAIKVN